MAKRTGTKRQNMINKSLLRKPKIEQKRMLRKYNQFLFDQWNSNRYK